MNTIEEVIAKAKEMEAAEFNFLGPDGKFAAVRRHYVVFEIVFIDGTRMKIPRSVAETPEFDKLQFKLRPTQQN